MIAVAKKVWLPLLIIVVVVIAGLTVSRIRTFFGSEGIIETPENFADLPEPFDPKVVRYEIVGNGSYADINYLDLDAKPQRVDGAALPWSLTLSTTVPAVSANILAQSDGDDVTCRILVDGEVEEENTATGVNAQTVCVVKSA